MSRHDAQWQPIETAPKDGVRFLAWENAYADLPYVVHWNRYDPGDAAEAGVDGYWAFSEQLIGDVAGEATPTHWLPIPAPPRDEQPGEEE